MIHLHVCTPVAALKRRTVLSTATSETNTQRTKKLLKSFKKDLSKRPSVLIFCSIYWNYSVLVGRNAVQGVLKTSFVQQNSQSLQNHDSYFLFFAFISKVTLYTVHICYVICNENFPFTRKDLLRKCIIIINRSDQILPDYFTKMRNRNVPLGRKAKDSEQIF